MKKLSLIFTITCILVLAAAGTAYAEKVYTEGLLQYTIDKNDNITIVRYFGGADEGDDASGDPDTYTVPWKIGNREVKSIRKGAFSKSDVGNVLIPEGVQVADGALRPDQTSESYKLVEEPAEPEHTDDGNPEWILPDIIRPGEMNLTEDTLTPNGRSVDLTVTESIGEEAESSEDIGIDYEGASSAASGSGGAAGGGSAYADGGPGVQDTDIPVAENISVEIASDAEGGPEEKDIILADDDWEDDASGEPVKKIAAADGGAAAGETAAAAEQSAGSETEAVEVSAEPAGKAAGTGRTVTAALIIAGMLAAGAAAVLFIRKRR